MQNFRSRLITWRLVVYLQSCFSFDTLSQANEFRLKNISKKDNTHAIYLITHRETGFQYVGSALNLKVRLDNYLTASGLSSMVKHNMYIAKAIQKHGYDAFSPQATNSNRRSTYETRSAHTRAVISQYLCSTFQY